MPFGPEEDRVEEELASRYGLDHSWTFRVDVEERRDDGTFRFTAEVVREYELGGRWCWFHGTAAADGTWAIEAIEPHSFGPEGADEGVVRARRRAIGRAVLAEARVPVVEAALRRRFPHLPMWVTTRVSREHVEANATVFDFATLVWEGGETRVAVWYVGRARVDLETYETSVDAHEHPKSRSLVRTQRTPRVALDAAVEEVWLELGFPVSERFLGAGQKRELLIAALRRTHPLDGTRSRLGHVNLRGEPDRSGSFHFAAEVWDVEGPGGRVSFYRGIVAPRGTSKIELLETLVYGAEGIDGVALRHRRSTLVVPLFAPSARRSMSEALLRATLDVPDETSAGVEIRTTEETELGGSTQFAFAAMHAEAGVYAGKVSYDLATNTFTGDVERVVGAPSWSELGFFRPDAAAPLTEPRDTKPPTKTQNDTKLLLA